MNTTTLQFKTHAEAVLSAKAEAEKYTASALAVHDELLTWARYASQDNSLTCVPTGSLLWFRAWEAWASWAREVDTWEENQAASSE